MIIMLPVTTSLVAWMLNNIEFNTTGPFHNSTTNAPAAESDKPHILACPLMLYHLSFSWWKMRAITNTSEGIKLSPTLWLVDATNCMDIVNSTWLREILDTSLQKLEVINHIAQSRTGVSFQYLASHWYVSIMIIKPKNGEIFHEEVCQVLTLVKLSFFVAIRPLTICVKLSSVLNLSDLRKTSSL